MLTWIKRAIPGDLAYKSYPPLHEIIDHGKAVEMEQRTRTLREEVDLLEKLLTERPYGPDNQH